MKEILFPSVIFYFIILFTVSYFFNLEFWYFSMCIDGPIL